VSRRYSLHMDRIDVTCMGDAEEHYLYAPYMPSWWDRVAFLRVNARRRFGWHSRAAKRARNVVQNMDATHSDGA